ncbi:hypothetical protein H6762_05065 [Candidatus Nomurabacteria bacterium]|nr:hypothetical protein [Candidatus Nomurabacteria bacterium]
MKSQQVIIGIFLLFLSLFVTFSILRSYPINTSIQENEYHQYGDVDRKVVNVYTIAKERAETSFFSTNDHFLFNGHNPSFYIFTSEMLIRAGIDNMQLLQLFGLLLFVVGFFFLYMWVYTISNSKVISIISLGFLMFSPFMLYHSVTIHTEPYDFLFFNIFIYLYIRVLKGDRSICVTVITVFSAFLLTQNYYMYYIPLVVSAIGLPWALRLQFNKSLLIMILFIPILSLCLVYIQMAMISPGGQEAAGDELLRNLLFRLVDMGDKGSGQYVSFKDDITRYLDILNIRIMDMFNLGLYTMYMMLGFGLFLNTVRERSNWIRIFVVLITAGLSWNFVFVQHTIIHEFTGLYGWYLWPLAFGFSINEILLFIYNVVVKNRSDFSKRETILATSCISSLIFIPVFHPLIEGLLLHFVNNFFIYFTQVFSLP